MKKPIIGLTGNFLKDDRFFSDQGVGARGQAWTAVANDFAQVVIKAGGIPVILPINGNKEYLKDLADIIDGLVLTGGADLDPLLAGQRPIKNLGKISPERDQYEMDLLDYFYKETKKPIFGICRGMQLLTVYFGGKLILDIPSAGKGYDDHSLNSNYSWAYSHEVSLKEDSIFYEILGKKRIFVNSFHHQAAAEVPASFKLSGQADDGIIEAMEFKDLNERFIMASQWHPEMLGIKDEDQQKLFAYFISQCK